MTRRPLGSGAALRVLAIVRGGAVVPPLQGLLADRIGVQHAFVLPLPCDADIARHKAPAPVLASREAAA